MRGRTLDEIELGEVFENQGKEWKKIEKDGKVYLCVHEPPLWFIHAEIESEVK